MVTVSNRFVYVFHPTQITGFAINPLNGSLNPLAGSPFPHDSIGAAAHTVTRSGRFLYFVQNTGTFVIGGFEIQPNGMLSPLPPTSVPTELTSLALSPNDQFLYAVTGTEIHGYAIGASGNLTELPTSPFPGHILPGFPIGSSFFTLSGATTHSAWSVLLLRVDGAQIGSSGIEAFSINADGSLTPAHDSGIPNRALGGIIQHPGGNFIYLPGQGGILAFRVDGATGSLTQVPGEPFAFPNIPFILLLIEPRGRFLFGLDVSNEAAIVGSAIDPNSGALSPLPNSRFDTGGGQGSVVVSVATAEIVH